MIRARLTTRHDDAHLVARSIAPDNTAEMETEVRDDHTIQTRIERESLGGIHTSIDDYVVNLGVAGELSTETITTIDNKTDQQ